MKQLIFIPFFTLICGCVGVAPIKTDVRYEDGEGKQLRYISEKDLNCSMQVDPETGKIIGFNIQALSSAPAYAQVERDKVAAEASLAQAKAISETAKILGSLAIKFAPVPIVE